MRIVDFISDVHLDFYFKCIDTFDFSTMFKQQKGQDLIIGGDLFVGLTNSARFKQSEDHVTMLDKFFDVVNSKYQNTYLVLGNHDYWGGCLQQGSQQAKQIIGDRAIVVDQSSVDIENVAIYGSTLWSNLDPIHHLYIEHHMNDFAAITVSNQDSNLIKFNDIVSQHNEQLNSLKKFVDTTDKKVVIVTHHSPSWGSKVQYNHYYNKLDSCFYNSYDNWILENQNKIAIWIHGHVHHQVQYSIGKTTIVSNPFGYYQLERTRELPFTIRSFIIDDNQARVL